MLNLPAAAAAEFEAEVFFAFKTAVMAALHFDMAVQNIPKSALSWSRASWRQRSIDSLSCRHLSCSQRVKDAWVRRWCSMNYKGRKGLLIHMVFILIISITRVGTKSGFKSEDLQFGLMFLQPQLTHKSVQTRAALATSRFASYKVNSNLHLL